MISQMTKTTKIEITPKTIFLFFGILLSLILLWLIKDVLVILLLALIIIATLSPLANLLEKYLRWRPLAVLVLYFLICLILLLVAISLLPPLIDQAKELINNLPAYTEEISWLTGTSHRVTEWWLANDYTFQDLSGQFSQSSQQIFKLTGSLFTTIGVLVLIIVISFYGLLAEKSIKKSIKKHLPSKKQVAYWQIGQKVYHRLGAWLRAQIIVGIVVGVAVGVGLKIIGLPNALFLGVLAGLLEIIPVIGPIFAAIPALLIALVISPITGLLTLALFILIHMLEGYILLPKVMEKALGLNPVLILAILLMGARLGGAIGILVAIPIASVLLTLFREVPKTL
jgi:predicted PurR-regulated permease PerM